MKVLIPVAAYHEYNTAIYMERAFRALGHDAMVITQAEYYGDLEADLFFAVDSAGPLNFPEKHRAKTAMWFIDSRHNCNPERRQPDDDTNAATLTAGGGWVFQAQKPDWKRNVNQGTLRSTWLPLAADPETWRPLGLDKEFDVGFGGNIWCDTRRLMLERIKSKHSLGQFVGLPEDLVKGYSKSKVGFNISGWFDTPIAYDINMRVFEIMACRLPLVTNHIPEMAELGFIDGFHYLGYGTSDGAMAQISTLLEYNGERRRKLGQRARGLIVNHHTYEHRAREALEVLKEAGVIEC